MTGEGGGVYRQMELHFPGVREVWQYHDQRCGAPGQKRQKRGKEARDVRNQRQKERKCRWRLRQYFKAGDTYVTLTCQKDKRPADMDEMKARWTAFMKELRKIYKKDGVTFRWIRNIEVGSKGAWHIHAALPSLERNMPAVIADAWPWGKAHIDAMYDDGKFQDLAEYLTKTPRTEKRLVDADHASSRNMPIPAPIEKTMVRWPTFEGNEIKMVPKGWYVDKDSIEEYLTPCGYPVRRYQLFETAQTAREGRKRKMVDAGSIRVPEHSTEPAEEKPSGKSRGFDETNRENDGESAENRRAENVEAQENRTECSNEAKTALTGTEGGEKGEKKGAKKGTKGRATGKNTSKAEAAGCGAATITARAAALGGRQENAGGSGPEDEGRTEQKAEKPPGSSGGFGLADRIKDREKDGRAKRTGTHERRGERWRCTYTSRWTRSRPRRASGPTDTS